MLARYGGQVWDSSEYSRSFGVTDATVARYLDNLTSALVVRRLQPWRENIKKRQVKAPKIYIADWVILQDFLNLTVQEELESHPKVGPSWEDFAIDQIVRYVGAEWEEYHFWATHNGAQLELLIIRCKRRRGFEFKRTGSPKITPSMRSALRDFGLASLSVVHSGEHTFPLSETIRAVPLSRLTEKIEPM